MSRTETERRPAAPPPSSSAVTTGRRIALVAVVAAAVWLYVTRISPVGPWHAEFDLKVYRGAVIWWLDHKPLYRFHRNATPYGFTYPPFAALVLMPWAWVSQTAAMVLNEILSALLIVLLSWWMVAPVAKRRGWPRWYAVALAVPLVYVMEPVRETLAYGQVNLILVALVLGDLLAAARGWRWAGIGIGVATAIKLTPGLFLVYLALTGRWRQAAVAVGTAAGATLLGLAVAPGTSIQFWLHTLFDTDRVGKLWYASNQSLMGVLARQAQPGQPNKALWAALALVVLIGGMWRARQAFRRGDELAGVTLTGLVTCLVSPISWTHHLFWLVPAALILIDVALGAPVRLPAGSRLRNRPRLRTRLAAGGAAVVVAVSVSSVMWLATDSAGHGHRTGVLGFLMVNSYVLVMVALVAGLPSRALRATAAGDPGGPEGPGEEAVSGPAEPSAGRTTAPPRPAGSSPR